MRFCACVEQIGDGSPQVRLPSEKITFRVDGDLPGISRADFEAACMEAWKRWERVIGIAVDKHPNPKTSPTQYVVTQVLDRAGGVLADQELPYGGGANLRMRVDTTERWVISDTPPQGTINLLAVLTHEDGHCLGMSHLPQTGKPDLLEPIYSPKIFAPQEGDIQVARKLYGYPQNPIPAPTMGPLINVEVTVDGKVYVAKGYGKLKAS